MVTSNANNEQPESRHSVREYHRIEQFVDPRFPGASTHSRVGDWEVVRVEKYTPDLPTTEFEALVICYCQYSPVSTPLEPLPKIQVSQEIQEVQS